LVAFLRGSHRAITALEPIGEDVLRALPELEVISKVGVGIDMLDLDALRRHNVRLGWARGTNARSVAELVIALALATLRHITALDSDLRKGGWSQRKGFLLSGRTVGIVGFGAVGREVCTLVAAFGCPVLVHDVVAVKNLPPAARQVPLTDLLEQSVVVSLHAAAQHSGEPLIGARDLATMRADAILINTARGSLIDQPALLAALLKDTIRGAALDVFADEPPTDDGLFALENVVLTPHVGGSTEEAILAMGRAAIAGLTTAAPVETLGYS
jgi:D-3-phosphoglycerate dehydrogenase